MAYTAMRSEESLVRFLLLVDLFEHAVDALIGRIAARLRGLSRTECLIRRALST
jgi:hypothetical protein